MDLEEGILNRLPCTTLRCSTGMSQKLSIRPPIVSQELPMRICAGRRKSEEQLPGKRPRKTARRSTRWAHGCATSHLLQSSGKHERDRRDVFPILRSLSSCTTLAIRFSTCRWQGVTPICGRIVMVGCPGVYLTERRIRCRVPIVKAPARRSAYVVKVPARSLICSAVPSGHHHGLRPVPNAQEVEE